MCRKDLDVEEVLNVGTQHMNIDVVHIINLAAIHSQLQKAMNVVPLNRLALCPRNC